MHYLVDRNFQCDTMDNTNEYIIEGGAEGKKRLDVLSRILEDSTRSLLLRSGSLEGKSILDVGCGGGHVSIMAAELVGSKGKVTALDFDEVILGLARTDAARAGVTNITFYSASAYDLSEKEVFDVAYSRFLLSHLTDPKKVLRNMIEAVKPGGTVIIEDIDFSGHYGHPDRWSFRSYVNLFTQAANNNGHNPNIGLSLYSMLVEEGLQDVTFNVVQPAFVSGEGKWMAYYTVDKISRTVTGQKLATELKVQQLLEDLADFTKDETTLLSMPRIFQVCGKRKD
jgi:ubiquinone/menaquinone biosynthesis C-methylase UbiE